MPIETPAPDTTSGQPGIPSEPTKPPTSQPGMPEQPEGSGESSTDDTTPQRNKPTPQTAPRPTPTPPPSRGHNGEVPKVAPPSTSGPRYDPATYEPPATTSRDPIQPGIPIETPARPPRPTFEDSLNNHQRSTFPKANRPPAGTDTAVAEHHVAGPWGSTVTVPAHSLPNVTATVAPLVKTGDQVEAAADGTIGTAVRGTTSARVAHDSVTTTSVAYLGDNKFGVVQDANIDGSYRGGAATDGSGAGSGAAYVTNTPQASNNGSTTQVSGQWTAPNHAVRVTVTGSATLTGMQLPKVNGGISVVTPMGTFKTPPIG